MKLPLLVIPVAILGCSCAQPGGGRIDAALAALVPADTILLSGIRMNELRATPLYTKMLSQQRLSELDDFAKQTNFDPRKDVNEMLLASNGVESVLLARGNFKIQAPAGMKKSTYKGATLYGKTGGAYAILDATTAVAGVESAVRRAIDQKQSGRPGPAPLLDRARALPGSGQLWFVSSGWGTLPERLGADAGNLSNMGRLLRTIENASGTADLRSGITATVIGQCRTDPDAKNVGDAARGMVGLGRLSVPENQPEMLRVFDGIKVEQKQRTVQVNVNISNDLIDKMLKMTETRPRPAAKNR
jgi:hypothetical protein